MRIVICEDNLTQAEYLETLAHEWGIKNKENIKTTKFPSAEAFLFELEDIPAPDIIFLDIQMGDMNGMELARRLREKSMSSAIIFITALKEYVFEGYGVDAVDYLLKPVNKNKLFSSLDKIVKTMKDQTNYILIGGNRVRINDIRYIESQAHYINIITDEAGYHIKKAIGQFQKELDSPIFIQCHRSFIVNLMYVKRITKTDVVLEDNTAVPLSRSCYKNMNLAFISYYKGGMK